MHAWYMIARGLGIFAVNHWGGAMDQLPFSSPAVTYFVWLPSCVLLQLGLITFSWHKLFSFSSCGICVTETSGGAILAHGICNGGACCERARSNWSWYKVFTSCCGHSNGLTGGGGNIMIRRDIWFWRACKHNSFNVMNDGNVFCNRKNWNWFSIVWSIYRIKIIVWHVCNHRCFQDRWSNWWRKGGGRAKKWLGIAHLAGTDWWCTWRREAMWRGTRRRRHFWTMWCHCSGKETNTLIHSYACLCEYQKHNQPGFYAKPLHYYV